MGLPRPGWAAVFAGAVVCLALCAGFSPAAASADPYSPPESPTEPELPEGFPDCPEAVEAPDAEADPVAAEVRRLRSEGVAVCELDAAERALLRERLWWLVAEAATARAQRVVTNERLGEVVEAIDGLDQGSGEPSAAELQYSEEIVEAIDASGNATKVALWFLCGCVVSLVLGFAVWRTFAIKP